MAAAQAGDKTPSRRSRIVAVTGWLAQWWWTVAAVVAAIVAAPWLVGPPCPREVVMATGSPEGAYHAFAQKYRERLAERGITLTLKPTAGSVENVALLSARDSGVSVALVQGGVRPADSAGSLDSLASLYPEPIFVFCRRGLKCERLTELRGRKVAIGPEGSGTRRAAKALFDEANLGFDDDDTKLLSTGGSDAAAALARGEIDAAVFVISPTAPLVRGLLEDPQLRLMNFRRAPAIAARFAYLSPVTLSEGLLDLHQNLPARDVQMVATTANLVARDDLHPALVPLLLEAAKQVHAERSLLARRGEFPTLAHVDFPVSEAAARWFESGPSFLYRWLPFHIAAWLDRMKLLLLPLATLLFPLAKAAPPLYRWRIRRKIYLWYRELRRVDSKLRTGSAAVDFTGDIERLAHIEDELADVDVPLSYMEEFYNLRLHVAFVLERLRRKLSEPATRLRDAA